MRLAFKFFLAFSLVILVLAGIAAWSLNEVGKLTIADRTITVKAAEALRSAASLREAVLTAKRVDMRSLVFADQEYTDKNRECRHPPRSPRYSFNQDQDQTLGVVGGRGIVREKTVSAETYAR